MSINNIQASVIVKEIPTEGHSPLLIIGSDYKKYVAKNGKGHKPPITIINECLANHLLKCWDMQVPDFSLVHFSKELILANELSKFHRPGVYDELAFGSAYLENVTDVNDFSFAMRKSTFNKFNNPLVFFRIALFDAWIENDDRRPTNYNLLFQSVDNLFNIIPIDHAFIFSTLDYDDLNPDNFWPSSNEHLLVSELAYLFKKYIRINDDLIRNEKQYFYFCVDKCEKTVDNFLAELADFIELSEESRIKIRKFLFNKERNKKVFDEYVFRLEQ